ncbi:MAG: hypothetical protein FWH07_08125, partial [Oscillospiraceae bacterium]|nr:hypothetical protein [Oscillospiraceae bacterium]
IIPDVKLFRVEISITNINVDTMHISIYPEEVINSFNRFRTFNLPNIEESKLIFYVSQGVYEIDAAYHVEGNDYKGYKSELISITQDSYYTFHFVE